MSKHEAAIAGTRKEPASFLRSFLFCHDFVGQDPVEESDEGAGAEHGDDGAQTEIAGYGKGCYKAQTVTNHAAPEEGQLSAVGQNQGDAVSVFAHIGDGFFSAADTHFFRIKNQVIDGFIHRHGLSVTGVNIAAPAGNTDVADGLGGDPVAVFFTMVKLQIISTAGKHKKKSRIICAYMIWKKIFRL